MADEKEHKCPIGGDTLQLGPELPDGTRPYLRHRSSHAMETGLIRPVKDGSPINDCDALLHLTPHRGSSFYKVESLYERPQSDSGPAQVATEAYRSGWDNIFGASHAVGQA